MYLRLEEYHRPESLGACMALLGDPGTAVIAGGTRLNVEGHEDLRRLVDLQDLPLGDIMAKYPDQTVRIGALTTLTQMLDADLPSGLEALGQVAAAEPNLPLRNRSTVGGRLSRNRSDGRVATALLALGAEMEVHDSSGKSTRDLAEWLGRDTSDRSQLLAAATIPGKVEWSGYLGFGQPAMAPPACDVALALLPGGVRVATGCHAEGAAGTLTLPDTGALIGGLARGAALESWEADLRKVAMAEVPAHTTLLAAGDWRQAVAVTLIVQLTERWLAEGGGA